MFGIGFMELALIAVVALLVIGPAKLPQFMRQAGRFFVQARRAATDVRSTFDGVVREAEEEIRREQADAMRAMLSNPKDVTPQDPSILAEGHTNDHDDDHNPDGTLKAEAIARMKAEQAQATEGMSEDPHHIPHAETHSPEHASPGESFADMDEKKADKPAN